MKIQNKRVFKLEVEIYFLLQRVNERQQILQGINIH